MNQDISRRRATDIFNSEIENLIASEEDPKQRVYLIVLNNLNNSLVANTETIRSVSQKLDTHLTKFEQDTKSKDALLHQGRGAWRVAAWVLGVAQVIAISMWFRLSDEIIGLHAADAKMQLIIAKLVNSK